MTERDAGISRLKNIYPDIPPAILQENAVALDRYLDLLARTFKRIAEDPVLFEKFTALTESDTSDTMEQRSNVTSDHHTSKE